MKTKITAVTVILLIFLMVQIIVTTPSGMAGGVIQYNVKVKNESPDNDDAFSCTVRLIDGSGNWQSVDLSRGATHNFKVDGPYCPRYLEGSCKPRYVPAFSMIRRCISGKEDSSDCPPACYGTDWFIRLHADRTAHFDKE